jgi:hypothetical protein
MYNSADQTAFVHPAYDSWNVNSTYFPGQQITYNGYNYNNTTQAKGQAQAPTGTTASNTWWSVAQVYILDSTTNKNPQTGQFSTWGLTGVGATGAVEGVRTGLPNPSDATSNNWNALSSKQTNNIGTGNYNLDSTFKLNTPNYAAGTNYVINNYVLYTDGYYYQALKPSGPGTPYGAKTPGTDQNFWKPFYYTTSDLPNIIRDGIPVVQLPVWNSITQYNVGDDVQYNGIHYMCTSSNVNSQPTGYYYSNANWVFISPSQKTVVSSSYWTRKVNDSGANTTVMPIPHYYDKNGNLINNTASTYTGYNFGSEGIVTRMVDDHKDLNGTTEASLANAATDGTVSSGTWQSGGTAGIVANMWRSSYGMASTDPILSGVLTYNYLTVDVGNPSGRFAMTFITDFTDTAHKTHGMVFAMLDANNFYYVTRTSLRQVVAGVDSLLASWTRLQNGDRIVVDADLDVDVFKYKRTGDGALTRIAHSAGTGPGDTGIVGRAGYIQKYSSTGAL